MTAQTIITWVLIVLGLALLILVGIGIYDAYKHGSPDEVCRLSILERATIPSATQNLVPLKCYTNKICLSLGDDCTEQFLGEKDVEKIELPANKPEEAAKKIEEISANAQYDCWSITGKGRLDLSSGVSESLTDLITPDFLRGKVKPACMICSRIAISPDLKNNKNILEQVDIANYLKNEKVPSSSLTYLQTFTDKQIKAYPPDFTNKLNEGSPKTTDHMAYVFAQIWATETGPAMDEAIKAGTNSGIAIGTATLGTAIILAPIGGLALLPAGAVTTLVSAVTSGGLAYYRTGKNFDIVSTYCGQLTTTNKDAKNGVYGCSFVMPVDYNDKALLNKLCAGGILGNP